MNTYLISVRLENNLASKNAIKKKMRIQKHLATGFQ